MALTQDELDAIDRLKNTYNGNAYDASTNAGGLADGGHRVNEIPLCRDVATAAEGAASETALAEEWAENDYNATVSGGDGSEYSAKHHATQAEYWASTDEDSTVPGGGGEYSAKHYAAKAATSASNAADYRDTALGYRNESETFRNAAQAAASASDKGIDATTTAGTGAAYTANFTPDVTVADGSLYALNIHAANSVTNPTLAIEGGTAYPLVIGYDRRPIPIGLLDAGRNIVITFDGTNNEYAIISGLPLHELNRTLDARGNTIDDAVIDNSTIQNTHLQNVTGVGARNFTASGAITSGDVVALNSDGTVSVISATEYALSEDLTGTVSPPSVGQNSYGFYDKHTDRVVYIHNGVIYIGEVSGGSITFGSGNTFTLSGYTEFSVGFGAALIPNTGKVLLVGRYINSLDIRFWARVATINPSTNDVTLGTEQTSGNLSNADTLLQGFLAYDSVSGSFAAVAQRQNNSYSIIAVGITVSGTTPTFGTPVEFSNPSITGADAIQLIGAFFDPEVEKFAAIVAGSAITDGCEITTFTLNGTTVENISNAVRFGNTNFKFTATFPNGINQIKFTFCTKTNHLLAAMYYGTTGRIDFVAFKLTGVGWTVTDMQSLVREKPNLDYLSLVYDEDSGIFCALWVEDTDNDHSYAYVSLTDSGLIELLHVSQYSDNDWDQAQPMAAGNGQFAIVASAATEASKALLNQAPWVDTNADDWIGVAQATVADTESVNVALRGSLDSSQTGLSGNNRYYIADDGSLTTTKNDRYAGRALSATELLLAGE